MLQNNNLKRQRIRVLEKKLHTKKTPTAYQKIEISSVNSFEEELEAFTTYELSDEEGKKNFLDLTRPSLFITSKKKTNEILDDDELKGIDANYKMTKKIQAITENNKVNYVCELILEIFSALMKNWKDLKEAKYESSRLILI